MNHNSPARSIIGDILPIIFVIIKINKGSKHTIGNLNLRSNIIVNVTNLLGVDWPSRCLKNNMIHINIMLSKCNKITVVLIVYKCPCIDNLQVVNDNCQRSSCIYSYICPNSRLCNVGNDGRHGCILWRQSHVFGPLIMDGGQGWVFIGKDSTVECNDRILLGHRDECLVNCRIVLWYAHDIRCNKRKVTRLFLDRKTRYVCQGNSMAKIFDHCHCSLQERQQSNDNGQVLRQDLRIGHSFCKTSIWKK